ncbi:hypothetical protein Bbelb_029460 [Branchiostoma belcheri]|nr:hypothetical protein Bbelb_029460 [Branchiostoma belcheri]
MTNASTKLSTVAEEFQELDLIFRSGGDLDVVEKGYGRKLIHAISSQNEVLECEALKSLADLYLHKAKMKKHKAKNFKRACALYKELLRFYKGDDERQVVQHRIKYAEKCTKLVDNEEGSELTTENPAHTTLSVSVALHRVKDKTSRRKGYGMMRLVEGYTKSLVKAIVERNKCLEIELLKSIGDLYLEKGRAGNNEAEVTKAAGLYRAALDRCEDTDGRETLNHRIKYTEKVQEIEAKKAKKRSETGPWPTLNNTDGTEEDTDSLYEEHLQEGCRLLQTGDLDEAERRLSAALRSVHAKGQHKKEAEPLYQLGQVYLKRGIQSKEGGDFTKAAALCNAALVRSRREDIEQAILEITKLFVNEVLKIKQKVDIVGKEKHKAMLKASRDYVEKDLERIEQEIDPYSLDEKDPTITEVEMQRVEAIKALFQTLVDQRKTFISGLVDECMKVMGPPPCTYAIMGLGSQATGLVTPYSDLEFAILVEEDTENNVSYFRNLTHYLHLKVINLGETILPAMAIKSLNDFYSDDPLDNWFYDSLTPRGFAFDGAMPHACKTPLGRGRSSTGTSELIRTPSHMTNILKDDLKFHLTKGYHLASILGTVSFITGEQGLVDEYRSLWTKHLAENDKVSPSMATTELNDNVTFQPQALTESLLNVKKDIYRFSSLAVASLALFHNIQPTTIWETIQELKSKGVVSSENAHHLMVMVSISAELRLRTYMNNRGQVENMSALSSMPTDTTIGEKLKKVFYVSNTKQLMRYYYTERPLKQLIPQLANPQSLKEHLIFYDNSSEVKAEALHMKRSIYGEETTHIDIAKLFNNLGLAWSDLGDYRRAISYYEQSLQMSRSIYGKGTAHADITASLHNLGLTWSNLGDYRKAISYYEQSLRMSRSIYGEGTAHADVAASLNNLGLVWSYLGDYRKAISYNEQSLQMSRSIYGEGTAHVAIARSLDNLGITWSYLGDERKAISYYEQSLQISRSIYGKGTAHADIAASLNNLGRAWSKLGDTRKAVSYCQQSLHIVWSVYGKGTAHPHIAKLLNNLGTAWGYLGDFRKAANYCEQSLQMERSIYGEGTAHAEIAASLNNLGNAWGNLGDHKKAVSYYEQSLQMRRSIYGKGTSLQMARRNYGEVTAHADIASSFDNLGRAWSNLGDPRKAVSYYEQSLQMKWSIVGEGTAHPDVAGSLNNLGIAWANLRDHRKAISYYEQSLQMNRGIYEKAWMEWVRKKDHGVMHDQETVLQLLRGIAGASTIEEYHSRVCLLADSEIWNEISAQSCDFETDFCGWTQATDENIDWLINWGPTAARQFANAMNMPAMGTGPLADHTLGNDVGGYATIPHVGHNDGDRARLVSQEYTNDVVLRFWYHLFGQNIFLNVYLEKGGTLSPIFTTYHSVSMDDIWKPAVLPIVAEGPYKIVFETGRDGSFRCQAAIDDITMCGGVCEIPPAPRLDCNFDRDLCGFQQDTNDDIDWYRHNHATPNRLYAVQNNAPSAKTGPFHDHTLGQYHAGYYMYIESSTPAQTGDVARLFSPETSGPCLQFYFHMFGQHMAGGRSGVDARHSHGCARCKSVVCTPRLAVSGCVIVRCASGTLQVYTRLSGSRDMQLQWELNGDRGDTWNRAVINHNITDNYQGGVSSLCDVRVTLLLMFPRDGGKCVHVSIPFEVRLEVDTQNPHGIDYLQSDVVYDKWLRDCQHSAELEVHNFALAGVEQHVALLGPLIQIRQESALRETTCYRDAVRHYSMVAHGLSSVIFHGDIGGYLSDIAIDDVTTWNETCEGDVWRLGRLGNWTDCTATCDGGIQNRTRYCDSPPPPYGFTCVGDDDGDMADTEQQECNKQPCPVCEIPPAPLLDCNFDRDLCGFQQDITNDDLDWTKHNHATPNRLYAVQNNAPAVKTGPFHDHTLGQYHAGYYMYIESSIPAQTGDVARLFSPETSGPCLEFYFHMLRLLRFSENVGKEWRRRTSLARDSHGCARCKSVVCTPRLAVSGCVHRTLQVYTQLSGSTDMQLQWELSGDRGDTWNRAVINHNITGNYQVLFHGDIGGFLSDIAIDDVTTWNETCEAFGGWGDWGNWTDCTATCDGGIQNRTRYCDSPPPPYGFTCVGDDDGDMADTEQQECNKQPCPESESTPVCTNEYMELALPAHRLAHVVTSGLHWDPDPSCKATFNGTHYILRTGLYQCGTKVTFDTKYVIFSNNVSLLFTHDGVITRDHDVVIRAVCKYDREEAVLSEFLPIPGGLKFVDEGFGQLSIRLDMFPTQSYLAPYTAPEYPVHKHLRDMICASDDTLQFYGSPDPGTQRFGLEAFRFVQEVTTVYIRCEVEVCDAADIGSPCVQKVRRPDESCTSEPTEMAEEFNEYFSSCATNLANEIPRTEGDPLRHVPQSTSTLCLQPVDETEVLNELLKLRTKKSTGLDKIPAKLLKDSAPVIKLRHVKESVSVTDGVNIFKQVPSFTYLGVTLDSSLQWAAHAEKGCSTSRHHKRALESDTKSRYVISRGPIVISTGYNEADSADNMALVLGGTAGVVIFAAVLLALKDKEAAQCSEARPSSALNWEMDFASATLGSSSFHSLMVRGKNESL